MKEKKAHVRYCGLEMHVISPYDPEFVSALKESAISRKWNAKGKEWIFNTKEREVVLAIIKSFFPIIEDNKHQS